MKAIYLAQIDGYDGRGTVAKIIHACDAAAADEELVSKSRSKNYRRIIKAGEGIYFFDNFKTDVHVRFEGDHSKVEITGTEDRVRQTKSELLKIVGNLTFN